MYMVQKEKHGWSLWTCTPGSGDRRDWIGDYRTKRDALRAMDKLYRRARSV